MVEDAPPSLSMSSSVVDNHNHNHNNNNHKNKTSVAHEEHSPVFTTTSPTLLSSSTASSRNTTSRKTTNNDSVVVSYHRLTTTSKATNISTTESNNTTTTMFYDTQTLYKLLPKPRNYKERFRAKYAPIMMGQQLPPSPDRLPVRVRVLLFLGKQPIRFRKGATATISDEVLNICMDGIQRSPYFDLVGTVNVPNEEDYFLKEDEEKGDMVWLIDMRRMMEQEAFSVPEQTLRLVQNTLQYYEAKNDTITPSLKVVFMDWRDAHFSVCRRQGGATIRQLSRLLGSENVRQVNQHIVWGRKWQGNEQFPKPGYLITGFSCFDYPALHMPYTVRSDYAMAIQEKYTQYLPADAALGGSNYSTPCNTKRPVDVAHFWTIRETEGFANLRNAVTKTVLSLNNATLIDGKPIQVLGRSVSTEGATGRSTAQSAYLEALLTTKIVVVAQRDGWEDHYRLFEAIVGGALVLTDPMHTLPDGYINGSNILIYHSLDQLRAFVLHYLEHPEERLRIASKGWELAMSRHRTYHWMEETFFGRRLTP